MAGDYTDENGFSVSAGLEYQLISQEYYDAIIDTSKLDPLEDWSLAKDEIDDIIFRTNIDYQYKVTDNLFNLLADMEYSSDRFLGRAEGYYALGSRNSGLKLFGKFESRSPNGESEIGDNGYRHFQTYLKGQQRISSRVRLNFKTGFEQVTFTDQPFDSSAAGENTLSGYADYDYGLLTARLGGDLALTEYTKQLYWAITYQHRAVPDSLEAEYDVIRVFTEFNQFDIGHRLGLEAELEKKNYARPDGRSDFTAIYLRGRWGRTLGHEIDWGLSFNYDNYNYGVVDLANRDYQLFRIKVQALKQFIDWGAGPFCRLEFKTEKEFEFEAEEYGQWELGAAANILSSASFFLDTELSAGRRNYREGNEILSSYDFISTSVMLNWVLGKHLSFNLVFDSNLESHEQVEDNSNLYLLTIGLKARF